MDELFKGFSELRSSDIDQEIMLKGKVRKVLQNKMKLTNAMFQCRRCGNFVEENQVSDTKIIKPLECYKEQGGCGRVTSSAKFILIPDQSKHTDYQEIVLEDIENNKFKISCILENENVGKLSVGDICLVKGKLTNQSRRKTSNFMLLVDEISDLLESESMIEEEEYPPHYTDTIIDIIRKLTEEGKPADHYDIINQAEKQGIEKYIAEKIIRKLHFDEGCIYETRLGSKEYRMVKNEID